MGKTTPVLTQNLTWWCTLSDTELVSLFSLFLGFIKALSGSIRHKPLNRVLYPSCDLPIAIHTFRSTLSSRVKLWEAAVPWRGKTIITHLRLIFKAKASVHATEWDEGHKSSPRPCVLSWFVLELPLGDSYCYSQHHQSLPAFQTSPNQALLGPLYSIPDPVPCPKVLREDWEAGSKENATDLSPARSHLLGYKAFMIK